MASVTDFDVLSKVDELGGATGEELLHELGFDDTDTAIDTAVEKRWIAKDADDAYQVTEEGQEALDSQLFL